MGDQTDETLAGTYFRIDIVDPKERVQAYLDSFKSLPDQKVRPIIPTPRLLSPSRRYTSYSPRLTNNQGFDEALMQTHLHIKTATAAPLPTATFELTVVPEFGNRIGRMHGGAVALLFDMCTTMTVAPAARSDFWHFGGVSRKLDVTYLRPAEVGRTVVVECEVLQLGRRLGE